MAGKVAFSLSRDANGNKIVRITTPGGGFSIQTSGNLPKTHRMHKREIDNAVVASEVKRYVNRYGTARQQRIVKLYLLTFTY